MRKIYCFSRWSEKNKRKNKKTKLCSNIIWLNNEFTSCFSIIFLNILRWKNVVITVQRHIFSITNTPGPIATKILNFNCLVVSLSFHGILQMRKLHVICLFLTRRSQVICCHGSCICNQRKTPHQKPFHQQSTIEKRKNLCIWQIMIDQYWMME